MSQTEFLHSRVAGNPAAIHDHDFRGKNLLITGAGNGLGLAMAEYLAAAGANLMLTDLDTAAVDSAATRLAASASGQILALGHDVADPDSWQALYQQVSAHWSQLHGLVNNAGIMLHRPFTETTLAMFRRTQAVNVDSVFMGVQTLLPLLRAGGEGGVAAAIVNVSSVFGQVAGPMHSAYCASKGAVRLLTKSMAVELPRLGYNVRCNSIHPGIMDTGVSLTALQTLVDMGQFAGVEAAAAYFAATIPMGRPGRAGEIAAGVAFLLSPAASFMTGAELTLDGGYSAV